MRDNPILATQIPFTSMRWYKLSLNTLPLSKILTGEVEHDEAFALSCMNKSVQSAAEMLLCFLLKDGKHIAGYLPPTKENWMCLQTDTEAVSRFAYAIDSYWMTHAFAIILLSVLYSRGAIDDHLFCKIPSRFDRPSVSPGEDSPLQKLLIVGREIFCLLNGCMWHPAFPLKDVINEMCEALSQISDEDFNLKDLLPIPLNDDLMVELSQLGELVCFSPSKEKYSSSDLLSPLL